MRRLILGAMMLVSCARTELEPTPTIPPPDGDGAMLDACARVTCSGHGVCQDDGPATTCVCNSGFEARGITCVDATCVPDGTTTSGCLGDDTAIFDSCGTPQSTTQCPASTACGPADTTRCATNPNSTGVCCLGAACSAGTDCPNVCGNGQVDAGEQCDGGVPQAIAKNCLPCQNYTVICDAQCRYACKCQTIPD